MDKSLKEIVVWIGLGIFIVTGMPLFIVGAFLVAIEFAKFFSPPVLVAMMILGAIIGVIIMIAFYESPTEKQVGED